MIRPDVLRRRVPARAGVIVSGIVPTRQEYFRFLDELDPALGLMLALAGLVYVVMGWRVVKVLLVLNGVGLGGVLGVQLGWTAFGSSGFWPIAFALAGAVLLGTAAASMFRLAATFCAALAGGFVGALMVGLFIPRPDVQLVGAIVGLLLAGSLVFVAFEQIVIVVLSFQGALMTVSGVLVALSQETGFLRSFREMAIKGSLLIPFCVIALTVIGTCLQLAGLRGGGSGRSA